MVLRGAILNRTYGAHEKTKYFAIFTNNIWSCLIWSPVIAPYFMYTRKKNIYRKMAPPSREGCVVHGQMTKENNK